MEHWIHTQLGNLVEVKSGIGFPKELQGKAKGTYPVYKVGDISKAFLMNNAFVDKAENYVSNEEVKILKGSIFREGSTVFAKIGEAVKLNRRGYISQPGLADNNVMAVIPLDNSLDRFIYFFLNTVDLSEAARSTTVPSIRKGDIENLIIPLPPLAEQHYLADKLDSLLTRIQTLSDQLAAVPALLKQFRQSVLADAVSGKLTVKWREETGNNDEWCSYLLKDITTKIGSGSTPKGGNSVYKTSGIPFVRSLNIYSDYIKYDDLAFIDMEQAKKLANVEIQENDVLLNITGASIGRVNIAPQAFVGGRVNQHVAIIRVKAEIAIAKYLHLLLASPEVQKWVHGENYGATRQALTKNMIEMLVVQLPSIAEQTEIVRRVEALFALADNIEQQSRAAAERVALLTQSVLAKAFRGELSEQWRREHPDLISGDNSAAALLARIQAERAATGKKSRRA